MVQTVELPNGDTIEFPDGIPPDAMSAAIKSSFPDLAKSQAPEKSNIQVSKGGLLSTVSDRAMDIGVDRAIASQRVGTPDAVDSMAATSKFIQGDTNTSPRIADVEKARAEATLSPERILADADSQSNRAIERDRLAAEKESAARAALRKETAVAAPYGSSAISGVSRIASNIADIPQFANDAIKATLINPILNLAGQAGMSPTHRFEIAKDLQQAADEFAPKTKNFEDLDFSDPKELGNWAAVNALQQAPQIALGSSAAFIPKLRNSYLSLMGAMTAAGEHQRNLGNGTDLDTSLMDGATKGLFEVIGESLGFNVYDKFGGAIAKMTAGQRASFAKELASRTLVGATALAGQMSAGAMEEGITQVGQNASSRYVLGDKSVKLADGVVNSMAVGALMEAPMGVAHAANAAVSQGSTLPERSDTQTAENVASHVENIHAQPDVDSAITAAAQALDSTSRAAPLQAVAPEIDAEIKQNDDLLAKLGAVPAAENNAVETPKTSTAIAKVDELLTQGYAPANDGNALSNGKKKYPLNAAQREYVKSLSQAAEGTAATSPEAEQPATPIQPEIQNADTPPASNGQPDSGNIGADRDVVQPLSGAVGVDDGAVARIASLDSGMAATGATQPSMPAGADVRVPATQQGSAVATDQALIPISKQAKSENLIQRVKQLGGISMSEIKDITGEASQKNIPHKGLLSANGRSIDDLATMLADEGFTVDTKSADGGVAELREMIGRAVGGEQILTRQAQEEKLRRDAELAHNDDIRRRANDLGLKTVGRKMSDTERVLAVSEEQQAKVLETIENAAAEAHSALIAELYADPELNEAMVLDLAEATQHESAAVSYGQLLDAVRKAKNERNGKNTKGGSELQAIRENTSLAGQANTGAARASEGTGGEAVGDRRNEEAPILSSYTAEDVARRERDQAAQESARRAEADAAIKAQSERDQAEIDARTAEHAANPDNFQFGENSKQAAEPVADLFSQPSELKQSAIASVKASTKLSSGEKLSTIAAVNSGAIAPEDVQDVVGTKIEDFGEKIIGARKEYAAAYKDRMAEAKTMDVLAQPLSKSWPEPDYQKLVDSGYAKDIVGLVRSMRDEIPNKPGKDWKQKTWAKQVEQLRDTADNLLSDSEFADKFVAEMKKVQHLKLDDAINGRAELYALLGHEKSLKGIRISRSEYGVYNGVPYSPPKIIWEVTREAKATAFGNMPRTLGSGDTRQAAIDAFAKAYSTIDTSKSKESNTKFELYADRYAKAGGKGQYFIGKKVGRNVLHIKDGFDTVKEAREYIANNNEELTAILEKKKEVPNERYDTNQPRVGQDMRNGQDVTPQMFSDAFGFRGVQFGNYVEGARRQKDLNDAYDALMDLAAVLDIPPKALSLDGELGLSFGARGTGGKNPASAHYEPGQIVINLTKGSGAGSLAHEWWHSLDNYFSRQRGKNDGYATDGLDVSLAARDSAYQFKNDGIRKEMIEAFGAVVKAINQTAIKERSRSLDGRRTKQYWGTGIEMSARSFERYVIAKLHDNGFANDYLANVVSEEYWNSAEALGIGEGGSYPYPTESELTAIRDGFDKFFQTIESKETDKGVALFSRAQSQTETPEFKRWFGDSKVVDADGKPLVAYHGTNGNFTTFDSEKVKRGYGMQFTDSKEMADSYGAGDGGKTLDVYLSLKNPHEIDLVEMAEEEDSYKTEDELSGGDYYPDDPIDWIASQEGLSYMEATLDDKSQSYDGYIVKGDGYSVYGVFDSTQIKSATGNNGQFDPENPDIRFSARQSAHGMPIGAVKSIANPIAEKLKNVRAVKVVARQNEIPGLKEKIDSAFSRFQQDKKALEENRTDNNKKLADESMDKYLAVARDNIEGAYVNGELYLVASNLPNAERVEAVLRHEVAHLSVEQMLEEVKPGLYDNLLSNVRMLDKAGNKYIRELASDVDRTQPGLDERTRAAEIIAQIAERGDHETDMPNAVRSLYQRLMDGIKAFYKLVFGDKLNDQEVRDIVAQSFRWARGEGDSARVYGGAENESVQASRGKQSPESFARLVLEELIAENDPIFSNVLSKSKSIDGVMIDVVDGVQYQGEHTREDERQESGADHRHVFVTGKGKTFYVYETDDGKVWIDVSRLDTAGGGQSIYAAVANYAYNTNKKFIGDPFGLSPKAVIRRTSNMLSSALRFGTTRHLEAAQQQIWGDPENGVEPLDWTGSDIDKVEAMIHTFVATMQNISPSLKEYRYDFQLSQFTDSAGRPVTGAAMAASTRSGSGIGEKTARRAVLLQTIISSESEGSSAGRGSILEHILRWGDSASTPGNLNSLFSRGTQSDVIYGDRGESASSSSSEDALIPEETTPQKVQRIAQDKMNRFSVIRDWLKSQGKELSEAADVWMHEGNMYGKVAARSEDFRTKTVEPLIERTQKAGFTLAQVAEYLEMQHIPEANKRMRDIHGDENATANGVTDEQAESVLEQYRAMPNFDKLQSVADGFRGITESTSKVLLDSGIITPEMANAWKETYQHYVPLKGDEKQTGTGKGLNVNGKTKRRLGHGDREEAVIQNILRDHERAINLSEKNKVGIALVRMAVEAQNDELVTVGKPERRQVFKDSTVYAVAYQGNIVDSFGTEREAKAFILRDAAISKRQSSSYGIQKSNDQSVIMMASPMLAENEVNVYINGHAVRVQLNDELLARAYTNLGVEHVGILLAGARSFNSWLSKAYTGYNPEFAMVNMFRDLFAGSINLTGDYGVGMTAKIFANYPKAFKELVKSFSDPAKSQIVSDYRKAGGNTGAAYLSDIERVGNDVMDSYNEYAGALDTFQRVQQEAKAAGSGEIAANLKATAKATAAKFRHIPFIGHFLKLMEHVNAVTENALRVATYMTLKENGYSDAKSAQAAKLSTVNFNRKGEMANTTGALYLFFNPNVQGTQRLISVLGSSEHKNQARALVGMMALGAFTLAEMMRGGDDEDKWKRIPGYVKDRNIVFMFGETQFTIPVPYGYGVFHTLGNVISDVAHGESGWKAGIRLTDAMFSNFSPVGNPFPDGDFKPLQLLPTSVKMAIAPESNENSFGSPIQPVRLNDFKPDSQNMNRTTKGTLYAQVAEGMNALTGGNDYRKGGVDVSPEVIKFWVESLTGGAGKFIVDTYNLGAIEAQGADPELRELPIIRKFVREPSVADARQQYYTLAKEAKQAAEELHAAVKHGDRQGVNEILRDERPLIAMAKYSEAYDKAIKHKRDAVDAIRTNDKLSLKEKRLQMKEIELKEMAIYNKFIETFEEKTKH